MQKVIGIVVAALAALVLLYFGVLYGIWHWLLNCFSPNARC